MDRAESDIVLINLVHFLNRVWLSTIYMLIKMNILRYVD